MDGQRFDTLAKAVAQGMTRRRLLGALGGALSALGLGSAVQASCPRATPINCQGTCVDLRTDPDHCGRCGRVCASGLCYAGRCLDGCPSGFVRHEGTCVRTCPAGLAACGGTCVAACSGDLVLNPVTCVCEEPDICAGANLICGVESVQCGSSGPVEFCFCAPIGEGVSGCFENDFCHTLDLCAGSSDCSGDQKCVEACCDTPVCLSPCGTGTVAAAGLVQTGPTASGR